MKQLINHPFWATHSLLVARVLMGGFFLLAGISKLQGGVDETTFYIEANGLPAPLLLAWAAVIFEIALGAAIILGSYFKEAALLLAAFTVIVSFLFHGPNLWATDAMQQVSFLKNMAVVAGLLFMAAHGPGRTWVLKK